MVYPYTVEDQLHCHRNMARDVNDIEMALISKLSFSYRIQKLEKKPADKTSRHRQTRNEFHISDRHKTYSQSGLVNIYLHQLQCESRRVFSSAGRAPLFVVRAAATCATN